MLNRRILLLKRSIVQCITLSTFTGSCVDHTIELSSEESVAGIPQMKTSIKKCRKLVDYMKDSSLAREFFYKLITESGSKPLAIIRGTSNR